MVKKWCSDEAALEASLAVALRGLPINSEVLWEVLLDSKEHIWVSFPCITSVLRHLGNVKVWGNPIPTNLDIDFYLQHEWCFSRRWKLLEQLGSCIRYSLSLSLTHYPSWDGQGLLLDAEPGEQPVVNRLESPFPALSMISEASR